MERHCAAATSGDTSLRRLFVDLREQPALPESFVVPFFRRLLTSPNLGRKNGPQFPAVGALESTWNPARPIGPRVTQVLYRRRQ